MALVIPNFFKDKPWTFNPERDFTISALTDFVNNGTGKNYRNQIPFTRGVVKKTFVFDRFG